MPNPSIPRTSSVSSSPTGETQQPTTTPTRRSASPTGTEHSLSAGGRPTPIQTNVSGTTSPRPRSPTLKSPDSPESPSSPLSFAAAMHPTGPARPHVPDAEAPTLDLAKEFTPEVLTMVPKSLYHAVNGEWQANTQIPGSQKALGTHADLPRLANDRLDALIETGPAGAPGSETQKVQHFHQAFTDTQAMDRAGLTPIQPFLNQISRVKDATSLAQTLGKLQGVGPLNGIGMPDSGSSMLLKVNVVPDIKDPDRHIVSIDQSGLGMSQAHYTGTDDESVKRRTAYQAHLEGLFTAAGDTPPAAKANAQTVFDFETQLAQAQRSRADNRDAGKRYNLHDVDALQKQHPELDWKALLQGSALPGTVKQVSISQPEFIQGLMPLLKDTGKLQTYMKARLLDDAASMLPKAFRDLDFKFRGQVLQGLKEPEPRNEASIELLNNAMGDALGKMYADKHISPQSKAMVEDMSKHVVAAMQADFDKSSLFTGKTREEAKDKLKACEVHVGYPDQFTDYSKLKIKPDDAVGNWANVGRFIHEGLAAKLDKKVDRGEWLDPPQQVNAYYDEDRNHAWILGAMMEKPLFDAKAHPAQNFAGIGVVLAHELSHGFDDQGSLRDEKGTLKDQWPAEVRKDYESRQTTLIKEAKRYRESETGEPMNSKLTIGESMADLRGIKIAFQAYQAHIAKHPPPKIEGVSKEQLFFLSFARGWRHQMTPEFTKTRLEGNPHPPPEYRVNLVRHLPEFHAAFNIQPGDAMYLAPEKRVQLS